MTIVTRTYDDYNVACGVVEELESAGVHSSAITFIGRRPQVPEETDAAEAVGTGAAVGGAAGLLAGLSALTIPGLGPVMGVGWLASTAVGAAAGAVVGGISERLVSAGLSTDEADRYATAVESGATIISVRAENHDVLLAEDIMDRPHQPSAEAKLHQPRNSMALD